MNSTRTPTLGRIVAVSVGRGRASILSQIWVRGSHPGEMLRQGIMTTTMRIFLGFFAMLQPAVPLFGRGCDGRQ